jgi:hypothetical protein
MPRKIAERGAEEWSNELTRAEEQWAEWQEWVFRMIHPRKPMPDYRAPYRQRPTRPSRAADPELLAELLANARRHDEKLRLKFERKRNKK